MAQPLSYEDAEMTFFITSKTQASRLWFVNNKALEYAVLSYLAKYQEVYGVILYAFVIMGNHYHIIARFPNCNKAKFMRSFNAMFAKLVKEHVKEFDQGRVWGKRYSSQALPRPEDVQHWCLYSALNPVSSGLCKHPSEYTSYNSFNDAKDGVVRTFEVFERKKFNDLNRYKTNPNIKREDFTKEYSLKYTKLPGLEDLTEENAHKWICQEHEKERLRYVSKREEVGQGFINTEILKNIKPGQKPRRTKSSTRYSFRPLVLTLCREAKAIFLEFYFALRDRFIDASIQYREGRMDVEFPPGTYPPSLVAVA